MAQSAGGTDIAVNELLCYVQNNFDKHPKVLVGVAIVGFYKEDEVVAAKQMLFAFVDTLSSKPEGIPRYKTRTAADNKKKLDCDDLLALYSVLDGASIKLPTYVAANLQRLPTVSPGEVDVFALAANVASLSTQLDAVAKKVASVSVHVDDARQLRNDINSVAVRLSTLESRNTNAASFADGDSWGTSNVLATQATTSDAVPLVSDNSSEWSTVAKSIPTGAQRARQSAPAVRVKGVRVDSTIKSVPRVLAAFVGRLHPDTTAEELGDHLSSIGIKGVVCRKLSATAKDGRKFRTAAFYVSCCAESCELFYDVNSWPEGVELRDWVYYNK